MVRPRQIIVIGVLVALVAFVGAYRRRALERNAAEFLETYGS
jgi:hypothetical protein